ncbi:hypothetical protein [Fluviicola taffensis]|uniref:Uncharacterized protein n=1 Tax=Fluviicola taffensis (strain DSM 16823 / NCIMB 13979 / RW262) TaxID=755732 RepID=F2IHV0_FLUTR|nr:hypothetical protein [Fluviicola taffensis]AEA45909.1 hypothetical protein Fluta_3945 [Fluviicola taffensis DSM 16823]
MNTFDEIIQTKAYNDLTSQELEVVQELVSSEEDYNEMKSFYAGIDSLAISSREEVSSSIKSSLNSVFQAKHPGISQNWSATNEVTEPKIVPLYNRAWFRVAALLVVSAGVLTIWISNSENELAATENSKVTASNDSSLQVHKEEAEPKKKFPINEGSATKITAASTISTGENLKDKSIVSDDEAPSDSKSAESYDFASPSPVASSYKSSNKRNDGKYFLSNLSDKKEKTASNEDQLESLSRAGIDADLNPYGNTAKATKDYKPAISTNDLLSLIEPSF